MATGFHYESAEIYQFPVGERRKSFGKRQETGVSSVIDFPAKASYDVIDTCWYHEEAVASEPKPLS